MTIDKHQARSYNNSMDKQKTIKHVWLTPDQVASKLDISKVTVYRYINSKSDPLPSYKISPGVIRVDEDELNCWIIDQGMKKTIEEEGMEHYE